jgi:anthranilate phosphoribosyltransferase
MAAVFDKMAALAGFSQSDCQELFAQASTLAPGEVGAVLGYLLGRLDSGDAAAVVSVLRELQPQRPFDSIAGRTSVNIVGTGGGPSTFNISTTAAFVVAATGTTVVKTGSGAIRSKSGFADVASRLGTLKVAMPWEEIEAIVADVGIVFVPPSHYPAAMGLLEQNLTVPVYRSAALYFNKIGPLLSPVRVNYRFLGANSLSCLQMLAGACRILGDIPTSLVSSDEGLDEVSTIGRTTQIHLTAGGRADQSIDPRSLGIEPPAFEALHGFEPAAAAECCERILAGKGTAAQADIVALNAGAVLASIGHSADLSTGFRTAAQILREGEGLNKLRQLRERVWKCVKR